MHPFFVLLDLFNDFLWSYIGLALILSVGIFLTWKSRGMQLFKLHRVFKIFMEMCVRESNGETGVHPLKVFFASVGGCIGIGNIVSVCTAIQIGGPGALFWLWVTAFFGMILKYAEVYLGIKYRVKNDRGSYDGGPMYYLQKAFRWKWPALVTTFLICIYGVEIHSFNVIVDSLSDNWNIPHWIIVPSLLALIIFSVYGGVDRVGAICSGAIPVFFVIYVAMSLWVIWQNIGAVPDLFYQVFSQAFSPSAAFGGFVGSTVLMTMAQGAKQGSYSGDLGVGFASIINSETEETDPTWQSALAIFGIILDTFIICTISAILILITDTWHNPINPAFLVQTALAKYFPYLEIFMPFLIFLLAFSTIIAYFVVGLKCARFLSERYGSVIYYVAAVSSWIVFSFFSSVEALIIMNIAGGLLMIFNAIGFYILRDDIKFDL